MLQTASIVLIALVGLVAFFNLLAFGQTVIKYFLDWKAKTDRIVDMLELDLSASFLHACFDRWIGSKRSDIWKKGAALKIQKRIKCSSSVANQIVSDVIKDMADQFGYSTEEHCGDSSCDACNAIFGNDEGFEEDDEDDDDDDDDFVEYEEDEKLPFLPPPKGWEPD